MSYPGYPGNQNPQGNRGYGFATNPGNPGGGQYPGYPGVPPPQPRQPRPVKTRPPAIRPFFIRSQLNGKVLDIRGANAGPGADVIMYDRKARAQNTFNQLWYIDAQTQTIRSQLNHFALDTSGGSVRTQPYQPANPNQQWLIQGNKIYNRTRPHQVLDIKGENSANGATIIEYAYKGSANQHWHIDYDS